MILWNIHFCICIIVRPLTLLAVKERLSEMVFRKGNCSGAIAVVLALHTNLG